VWWYKPVILALRRLRQENGDLKPEWAGSLKRRTKPALPKSKTITCRQRNPER
jgi:hypothetical protein